MLAERGRNQRARGRGQTEAAGGECGHHGLGPGADGVVQGKVDGAEAKCGAIMRPGGGLRRGDEAEEAVGLRVPLGGEDAVGPAPLPLEVPGIVVAVPDLGSPRAGLVAGSAAEDEEEV